MLPGIHEPAPRDDKVDGARLRQARRGGHPGERRWTRTGAWGFEALGWKRSADARHRHQGRRSDDERGPPTDHGDGLQQHGRPASSRGNCHRSDAGAPGSVEVRHGARPLSGPAPSRDAGRSKPASGAAHCAGARREPRHAARHAFAPSPAGRRRESADRPAGRRGEQWARPDRAGGASGCPAAVRGRRSCHHAASSTTGRRPSTGGRPGAPSDRHGRSAGRRSGGVGVIGRMRPYCPRTSRSGRDEPSQSRGSRSRDPSTGRSVGLDRQ